MDNWTYLLDVPQNVLIVDVQDLQSIEIPSKL